MTDGLINLGLVWLLKTKLLLEKSWMTLNPVKWTYMKIVDIWRGKKIGVILIQVSQLRFSFKIKVWIFLLKYFILFQVSSAVKRHEWCTLKTVEDFYQSQNLSSWCRFKDKQNFGGRKIPSVFLSHSSLIYHRFFQFLSTKKFWQFTHAGQVKSIFAFLKIVSIFHSIPPPFFKH